ncbi:MAG TPA: DUF4031 domain-containing protein [Gemmatimonadales bacterium]|nr:DUF4031 domain-containing protein [Gemmatimonadales bacterium]
MLLMDRENLLARGWSHVVSDTDDLAELEELRVRVGAPPRALQFGDGHRPHLDLKLEPRERALADPGVRVFDRTRDLVRHLHSLTGSPRDRVR